MIIVSTIAGIVMFVGGCAGLIITWINHQISTLPWIEGVLTYGMFTVLGLAIIAIMVMTPRES